MTDTAQDKIQESAAGPKRVRGDSAEVEQHPLPDQIAADRYLASKAATTGKKLGIRTVKLVPPGAD